MASLFRSLLRLFQAKATEPNGPPCYLLGLTDDLLQEIFFRIGSPADLIRASAACVAFRRLITGRSFLRRYCSLHPRVLLGFISSAGFHPAHVSHPSAACFSFDDHLHRRWNHRDLCDARDGLVLLKPPFQRGYEAFVFPELTVWDPPSRRYLLLPPIPNSLLASAQIQEQYIHRFEASLVPRSGEEEDDRSFRVIGRTDCLTNIVVFVFSSISGCWTVGASTRWDTLSLNIPPRELMWGRPRCAYGSFYWKTNTNKLLKLDMKIMEFSTQDLPPDHDKRDLAIVEAGEGELAMFSRLYGSNSVDFYTFVHNGNERANEWHVKDTIPLPNHYSFYIIGSAEGYIFLAGIPRFQDRVHTAYFSLEIKTFNIEEVCIVSSPFGYVYPYFGFLPPVTNEDFRGYVVD